MCRASRLDIWFRATVVLVLKDVGRINGGGEQTDRKVDGDKAGEDARRFGRESLGRKELRGARRESCVTN